LGGGARWGPGPPATFLNLFWGRVNRPVDASHDYSLVSKSSCP
jgi:hypothetical protein